MPKTELSHIFWTEAIGEKHLHRYSENPLLADHRLYSVRTKKRVPAKLFVALLNSSVSSLFTEMAGRVSLGEGVLDIDVVAAREYMLIPDTKYFTSAAKSAILKAFDKLSTRPVKSVFEEVKMKDRQKLDSLILEALGLDTEKYLQPIYDGLTELVGERIGIAKMRKTVKLVKTQRDTDKLKKQVIDDLLPNGVKKFPEEFITASLNIVYFKSLSIPKERLKFGMFMLQTQEVISNSGFSYWAQTVNEAKYIIYSQKPDSFVIIVPLDNVILTNAVIQYEQYLRKLKGELFQAFFDRTFDHKLSDTLAHSVFVDFGIIELG